MLKIITKKEYEELINTKNRYRKIIGECFTLCTGARSRRGAFLQMSKEELVRIIFDLNKICVEQSKELIKNAKDKR